jgi:hypothetical protein
MERRREPAKEVRRVEERSEDMELLRCRKEGG